MVLGQLIQVSLDDIWLLLGIAALIVAFAGVYYYLAKPCYSVDAHVRVEAADNTSQALTHIPDRRGDQRRAGHAGHRRRDHQEPRRGRAVQAELLGGAQDLPAAGGAVAARLAAPGKLVRPWLGMISCARGGEQAAVDLIDVTPALEGKKLMCLHAVQRGRRPAAAWAASASAPRATACRCLSASWWRGSARSSGVRQNDLDAITAFQSAIQVTEQDKQTGVVQISLGE